MLLLIELSAVVFAVHAEFNLVPLINEAVIGESTYFDCTTTTHTNAVHWYHYRVGGKDHEDICIYCLGKVHPQYKNKIEVERIFSTDTYRLKIRSVQREDAGRYICQENGGIGDSISAKLVVLVSAPICHTSMKPDGLLGPNSCNIEPDVLQMTCNVSYHGDIPPKMQWREVRSADPIKSGLSCGETGSHMACDLAMNASFVLHGSSYVCETITSATTQYNCSSGVINIIHVTIDNTFTEMANDAKETVNCLANCSQPCSYTWKWFDELHEEVVSNSSALTPSKAGWHKCDAECSIRGNQCTVLTKVVHVSEQNTEAKTMRIILIVLAILLIIQLCVIVAVFIIRVKRERHQTKACERRGARREQFPSYQSREVSIDTETLWHMLSTWDAESLEFNRRQLHRPLTKSWSLDSLVNRSSSI